MARFFCKFKINYKINFAYQHKHSELRDMKKVDSPHEAYVIGETKWIHVK